MEAIRTAFCLAVFAVALVAGQNATEQTYAEQISSTPASEFVFNPIAANKLMVGNDSQSWDPLNACGRRAEVQALFWLFTDLA